MFKELSPLLRVYHSEYTNRRCGQIQIFLVNMLGGQDRDPQRALVSTVMKIRVLENAGIS
jgi:hypothetical protein